MLSFYATPSLYQCSVLRVYLKIFKATRKGKKTKNGFTRVIKFQTWPAHKGFLEYSSTSMMVKFFSSKKLFWWPSLRKHNIFSPEWGPCVHGGNYHGVITSSLGVWMLTSGTNKGPSKAGDQLTATI